jgi:hypothetical protein
MAGDTDYGPLPAMGDVTEASGGSRTWSTRLGEIGGRPDQEQEFAIGPRMHMID